MRGGFSTDPSEVDSKTQWAANPIAFNFSVFCVDVFRHLSKMQFFILGKMGDAKKAAPIPND